MNFWIARRRHRDFIAARRAKVLDFLDKLLVLTDKLIDERQSGLITINEMRRVLDTFTKKEAE